MAREFKNEWKHLSENGIAANPHETLGGIIDKTIQTEEWFIIFNHPDISAINGLQSKAEAFKVFEETLKANGITE